MTPEKELLNKHTYKSENLSTGKRVFYSLHQENDKDRSKTPTQKYIGLLTEQLQKKGILTEDEIDGMLLNAVYY